MGPRPASATTGGTRGAAVAATNPHGPASAPSCSCPPRQQLAGNFGGLVASAFGREVRREIARHGDQDMAAFVGVAPLLELPHTRLEHLVGVEARVLAQHGSGQRGDQQVWRMAEPKMTGDQPCRQLDLVPAVEAVEQGRLQRHWLRWQIVQPASPFSPGRRAGGTLR